MKLERPVLASEIARILGKELFNREIDNPVSGINEIHNAEENDLIFVDFEKYYGLALNSPASLIIAPPDFNANSKKSIIHSENPFSDFLKVVNFFFKEKEPEFENINGVMIAKENVSIGKNVKLYPGVVIFPNTKIGDNVIIGSGTIIGSFPFYYKKINGEMIRMPALGGVVIENNVEIGASVTIDKGVLGYTVIGEGTKIDNLVHIAHDVKIGKRCIIAAQVGIAGNTIIEDEVTIWGQAGITNNVRIGKRAVIYAQAGVYCSLEGNEEYLGSPAEPAKRKWRQFVIMKNLPYQLNNPSSQSKNERKDNN